MRRMATMPTDTSLVLRLQQRDRYAWEELYRAYEPRLRRFAHSLTGNGHDADDLVSETFLRALPALDRLDAAEVNLEAYLFATTRNLFLKGVSRTRRAEPVAEVPEPLLPVAIEDDPERMALLAAQQDEVRLANASLQPRQRLVLALCELEERSYADIGELVGLNENAVAQLVYRARESLRTELRLLQVDPGRLPPACRGFLPALSQHLDGQLKEPRRSTTLAHLKECERCQAALADMREAQRRYRALFPLLATPTDDALARIDRGLDEAGYWEPGGEQGARWPARLARRNVAAAIGAAALCVGGGLGVAALVSNGEPPQPLAAPATAAASTIERLPPTTVAAPASTVPAPPATTANAAVTATLPETGPAQSVAAPPAGPPTTQASTREPEPPTAKAARPPKAAAPVPAPAGKPKQGPTASVDATAPTVRITRAPPATTSDAVASIAFSSSEPGTTFACRLDGGSWAPCTSPHALKALARGPHTLDVRGTDRAGNAGLAKASWEVVPPPDTTPPTVSITSAPPASTPATSASFAFAGSEEGLTFTCSLDEGSFAACASPASYEALAPGDHTFSVRASDAAGNTGSAAHPWTITAPALPDLLVSSLRNNGVTVRNAGTAPAGPTAVVVSGIGTFTISGLGPAQSVSFTWTCKAGTLTAVVDPGNAVAESNEGNNTTTRVTSCLGFGS